MTDSATHLKDLHPDPRNARRHTPRNVGMIESALREVGAARSIVIDEANTVLAGNATIEAAAAAGIERVQVIDADGETIVAVRRTGLTPEQKARLALYDNRAAELAEWDEGVLAELAGEIDLSGLFRDDELEALLGELDKPAGNGDPDAVPEPPADPITRPGDLWLLGEHRLLCGDSTNPADVARLMGGGRAAMAFADPPYGVDYVSRVDEERRKPWGGIVNDDLAGASLHALLRSSIGGFGQSKYVCCNWQSVVDFFTALGRPNALIVWDKNSIGLGAGYRNQHEFILFYGKLAHNSETNVWRFDRDAKSDYQHPTQKPVELVERALCNSSAGGDVVYDPFLGSGTTLIAAEQLGRRCFGLEIEPRYCDVIVQRWEQFTGGSATREAAD